MPKEKLTDEQKQERKDAAIAVGERIRQRRESLGMNRQELARRAGYAVNKRSHTTGAIYNIEAGNRNHLPGPEVLNKICEALDTTTRDLFKGIPNPRKRQRRTT